MPGTNHFADLTDAEFDATAAMDANELKAYQQRKAAHVVNGGESTSTVAKRTYDAKAPSSEPCVDCRGSGRFIAYTGRRVGKCFKCDGTGVATYGQLAAAKGTSTKEAKREAWLADHTAEIEYLRVRQDNWSFAADMLTNIAEYGSLTSNQLTAVQNAMAKDATRASEAAEKREANSGEVDLTAIDRLFATAKSHGLKKPIWRAAGLEIHMSRQFGDDTLWIKGTEAGRYVGKIIAGKFIAFNAASAETLPTLREIAADPTKAAIAYGQATNRCCCCGKGLTFGVSVVAGIGPICAEKWGLSFMREEAADEVQAERALHAPAKVAKAPSVATGTPRTGTKKDAVKSMLVEGTTAAAIAAALGVSDAAAKALIGDVKRMGVTVTRDGDTYRSA